MADNGKHAHRLPSLGRTLRTLFESKFASGVAWDASSCLRHRCLIAEYVCQGGGVRSANCIVHTKNPELQCLNVFKLGTAVEHGVYDMMIIRDLRPI